VRKGFSGMVSWFQVLHDRVCAGAVTTKVAVVRGKRHMQGVAALQCLGKNTHTSDSSASYNRVAGLGVSVRGQYAVNGVGSL